ncbi:O-antigen ligase family protein [Bradyrhizobium sp. McL0616]|uniref:O-antigen ligase family protein n=1 Tax=Bradyrhizobium sp. McL0616 TaxID=3415674 RepID=UPI003CE7B213
MKWITLFCLVASAIALSAWLRRYPNQTSRIWVVVGCLPLVMSAFHSYIGIISWPEWPGYAKGMEFSVLDVLVIALFISLRGRHHRLPFRISMALYLFATLLSMVDAEQPIAVFFYVWQIARMFLLYAVVTQACKEPRVARAILNGMAVGLILEACITIWQRFGEGVVQASGTFIHQNSLGLVSHFIVFPFFALLLAGRGGWLPFVVVLSGVVVEVLTTSRATVGLAGVGFAMVFVLSALRQWKPRKGLVLLGALAILALVLPFVSSSFEQRFSKQSSAADPAGEEVYDERAAYVKAARLMLSDYPLGVGANHFVLIANTKGYDDLAGVSNAYTSRIGNVHNIYWLAAAETGYLGVIALVILFLQSSAVAFRGGFAYGADERGDIMMGLGVGLVIVCLHSYVEWILITYQSQYMLALNLGLIGGFARQLQVSHRSHSLAGVPHFNPQIASTLHRTGSRHITS